MVGFGSAERAVVTVGLQAAIAALIYLLLGTTALRGNADVRLATALAPLAVFPLLFIWKMITVPAAVYREQCREEDQERISRVFYLSQLYLKEEHPAPNYNLISYDLALPPEDWINRKLADLEFPWRVRVKPGAKFETYDIG